MENKHVSWYLLYIYPSASVPILFFAAGKKSVTSVSPFAVLLIFIVG